MDDGISYMISETLHLLCNIYDRRCALKRCYLGNENVCFVTDVFSIWFTYDYGLCICSNKFINKKLY